MIPSFRDRAYASRRFAEIVAYARTHNPFYSRWIDEPNNPPLLDRETVLQHNEEILGGHPVTGVTSGSTGIPIRFSHSNEWERMAHRDIARFVERIGGRVPTVHLVFLEDKRRVDALDVGHPVDEQIDFIIRRRRESAAVAVTTYPSNAELLCQAVLRRNLDMSFIVRFGMYAEAVEQHHRDLVSEAFPNAKIWTTYSAKEFGMIAWMCPYEPDYHHITAHRLGVEILRDDNLPAADGERGRVVVTDFFNTRSPFIRYELGDLAIPGTCPCGRFKAPAFQRILGKVVGTLLHRDGHRVVYSGLSASLKGIAGIRQYQVVQHTLEDVVVKVVADRIIDAEIRRAFATSLGYVPKGLRIEPVRAIPRGQNGKTYWCYSFV